MPPVAGDSKRAIISAPFANGGIAIAKFVGFLMTGAASLLAEAVHALVDTSNQGLRLRPRALLLVVRGGAPETFSLMTAVREATKGVLASAPTVRAAVPAARVAYLEPDVRQA